MRPTWRHAVVGSLCVGMAVVAAPSVAVPRPQVWEVKSIDCTGTYGDRELIVSGYFDADNVSGGGDAEFHDTTTDPVTPIWGNVEDTSTYDGTNFVLDVTFTYGTPWDGEEEAAAAAAAVPGTSAGTMTITGTATPSGEPVVDSVKMRDGNTWTWWTHSVQALAGAGSITSATGDVAATVPTDLACGGHISIDTVSVTTPATYISRGSYTTADCALSGPAESFLQFAFFGEEAYGGFGIGVDWDAETADWWASGPVQRSGSSITADFEVFLPEEYAGAVAHLDLTVGSHAVARGSERLKGTQTAEFERWVEYPLAGTLSLPDDTEIAISDCALRTTWTTFRYSSQAGQKPGGKPPVNDLPSGALALDPGSVGQSTRGAAVDPEAACVFDTGEGTYEVPFGRTVWYSFKGTGGDVTISTLGTSSEFDTVLGIYDAGTMQQVACADEGPDPKQGWAAQATVPTTQGTAYLVQVGGAAHPADGVLDPDWGDLVLTRS